MFLPTSQISWIWKQQAGEGEPTTQSGLRDRTFWQEVRNTESRDNAKVCTWVSPRPASPGTTVRAGVVGPWSCPEGGAQRHQPHPRPLETLPRLPVTHSANFERLTRAPRLQVTWLLRSRPPLRLWALHSGSLGLLSVPRRQSQSHFTAFTLVSLFLEHSFPGVSHGHLLLTIQILAQRLPLGGPSPDQLG